MRAVIAFLVGSFALAGTADADNWPQWRGPRGTGIAQEEGLPTRWSSEDNIVWKAPLRGLGVSSPVVWDDRIMLTYQIGRGVLSPGSHPTLVRGPGTDPTLERPLGEAAASAAADPDAGRVYFVVAAFHRSDGRQLWEYQLEADEQLPSVHRKANLASASSVTDGSLVYALFGTGQLVALDMNGQLVWERHLGEEYSPFQLQWGHASSPTLYEDLLILLCDHVPAAYLLALDKRTGQEQWKVDRGRNMGSYSTPLVVPGPQGDELIVNSSLRLDAYDPSTGEWLWQAGEPNSFPIGVATYDAGMLYTSRGYRSGPYMAIRLGGRGDVSDTHVEWRVPTGAPYISSILYYDGLIYMANGNGIASGIDAKTGVRVWQERIGGIFTASPVAGDGKVYLLSETGETVVLRAGRTPQILSRNDLGERSLASPAISNGQLFIRTDQHLVCIGN